MSTAPILPLLEALPKARATHAGSGVASCPGHDDASPSLSWTQTPDRVLVKCHAGCTTDSVVGALGMTAADLFAPSNGHAKITIRTSKPAAGPPLTTRRFEAIDTDGRTWTHTREEDSDGRRVGVMPWQKGVRVASLLPFGAELLGDWPADEPIIVVEGEATALSLRDRGLHALGTFGTSYEPEPAALAPLQGRRLVLWPDADDPGRKHMLDLAERLKPIAGAVSWIEPPADVFTGWDARDADDATVARLTGAARPVPAGNDASIGSRTAADLRFGIPPAQLAHPFLTPEGATVVYARGGTGKTTVACWLAQRLVAAGHVVMVVDYEGHEREWGHRLRGLGMTDDALARIHYRAPFGADWTAEKGPLSKVAALIREDAARLSVTYVIVDSYSVATSNGDTMGGEQAAREYFTGLSIIGLPSLTIAHVRGDSGRFPDRPFGSVFVHNLARETWAVERVGTDVDDAPDSDELRFGPNVVALELRNKKANARAQSPVQFVTFSFYGDGSIDVSTDPPGGRSVADIAADALTEVPLTLSKLVAAIREDTGQAISEDTLRKTLGRHPQRFVQSTTGRPRTWTLR